MAEEVDLLVTEINAALLFCEAAVQVRDPRLSMICVNRARTAYERAMECLDEVEIPLRHKVFFEVSMARIQRALSVLMDRPG
jgi:hypothetical protein